MFHGFLGKNTCIDSSLVVLYFSIPHGVLTFCLCQTWLAEGMKPQPSVYIRAMGVMRPVSQKS